MSVTGRPMLLIRNLVSLGCFLIFAVSAVNAEESSYRYLESSYLLTDIAVADGDGGSVAASGLFNKRWIIFGRYAESEVSGPLQGVDVDAEMEFLRAGFGYRSRLPGWSDTDGYVLLSYNEIELSDFEDEPESGEDFEIGVNHTLRHDLVLNFAARYFNSSIDGIDLLAGDIGWRTGAVWRVTKNVGFSFSYQDIGNYNEWAFGLRGYLF